MNKNELIQNIKEGFLINASTNFAIHGFSGAVMYFGGAIPSNLIVTDLLQAGLRSTVAVPTQNLIEFALINYHARNGNEVKFSTLIRIRAESVAISTIISKFVVPSRRNAITLIVQPILLSSLSVFVTCFMNLQKTGQMLQESFPEEYDAILQILNDGGFQEFYQDLMDLFHRINS